MPRTVQSVRGIFCFSKAIEIINEVLEKIEYPFIIYPVLNYKVL